MIYSIHPMLHQVAAWWDGHICDQKEKFKSLPLKARTIAALMALKSKGLATNARRFSGEETWDPPVGMTVNLQCLEGKRLVFEYPEEFECDEKLFWEFFEELYVELHDEENIEKCRAVVWALIGSIVDGYFLVTGWSDDFRLEYRMTDRGACAFGGVAGMEFISLASANKLLRSRQK